MILHNTDKLVVVKGPRVRPVAPLIKAGLRPHEMYWEIYDKHGNLIKDGEVYVHNIVLDQTWDDLIASNGFVALTQYAAVGTGSSTPSPTQTVLDNEVARTNSVPSGEHDSYIYINNGVFEITRVRQFDETQVGSQNLTEWGWSPSGTDGGLLSVRELFRDSDGNPITITLDSDQSLRMIYKQQITVLPEPLQGQSASFNLQNVGTFNGTWWITNNDDDKLGPLAFVDYAAKGDTGKCCSNNRGIYFAIKRTDVVAQPTSSQDFGYLSNDSLLAFDSYTSGDRHRNTQQTIVDQNRFNETWYGIAYIAHAYSDIFSGKIRYDGLWFDWGGTLEKDNVHKLIVDPFTIISWGP